MVTTLGCRAQSTVWRKRLLRGMLGGISALACLCLAAGTGTGRAEPLTRWSGPVPPLSLAALDGARLSLAGPRRSIVIVHFFATWCETCGPELQALDRLLADYASRLEIIAVDVGEPVDRIRRYFQKRSVGFRIGLDPDRASARAWGVHTLPSTFVLDSSLAPRLQATGDVPWDDPAVRRALSNDGTNHTGTTPP